MHYNQTLRPTLLEVGDSVTLMGVIHYMDTDYDRSEFWLFHPDMQNDWIFCELGLDAGATARRIYNRNVPHELGCFPPALTCEEMTKMVNYLLDIELNLGNRVNLNDVHVEREEDHVVVVVGAVKLLRINVDGTFSRLHIGGDADYLMNLPFQLTNGKIHEV